MTAGGTKTLWLVTVGLAVLYLGVWAVGTEGDSVVPRQTALPAAAEDAPDRSAEQRAVLEESASADAAGRVDSRATLEVTGVKPKFFSGPDLQPVAFAAQDAKAGLEITILARVDGEPVSKLTYHAVPPDRVVFVRQEEP